MLLRPAVDEDVEPVRRLVRTAFRPYIARIGREPTPMGADYGKVVAEGRCWVLDDGGAIAGMVQIEVAADYLEVETLAVAPDARDRGLGTRLLGFAEERARSLGLPEIRLYTNEAMTENIEYYPRRGFHEIGRLTQQGFGRVLFAKPVTPG